MTNVMDKAGGHGAPNSDFASVDRTVTRWLQRHISRSDYARRFWCCIKTASSYGVTISSVN